MPNRYPWWKNLLILLIVILGLVYALPNLYAPDPAVQISGQSSAVTVDQSVLTKASAALEEAGIGHFGGTTDGSSALIRLDSKDDQLNAQCLIQNALQEDYVVALNLAPTTPQWLSNLGGAPMKLGLDLSGGVHFLLEVNTRKAIMDRMQSFEEEFKKLIIKQRLRGVNISLDGDVLQVMAKSAEIRDEAAQILREEMSDLEREKSQDANGNFLVRAKMSDLAIREIEDYAVTQNLATLRNRVNELGVSEPLVQRQGRNRIVVELPGVQDTAAAKRIIGKTANLEFRLEAQPSELVARKERFDFRSEMDQRRFGGAWLEKSQIIAGTSVTNAQLGYDPQTSLPQVNITLDSDGGTRMHRKTRDNVGRRMGVLFIEYKTKQEKSAAPRCGEDAPKERPKARQIVEKKIISLATIQSALGKQFRITGLDNPQEASELALLLRAGALAAPMVFAEERTIGPSLGADNIELGIRSVQLGLGLVLVFMLVFYRVFGLAANIALGVNLMLLIAAMSLFGATLTLPGIAGIVLTVGIAVDANVLIFSRIREELRAGMPPQTAIRSGFDRAFETILDANLTTLIVAVILFAIGSGPIKGFAVTLSIGILTSMFTAILGTRAIINLIYGGRNVTKLHI